MAKNTDKTKKKPQKRNKNSASMEELQQAHEAARTAEVRQGQGRAQTRTQEVQRVQDPQRTQELQRVREVQRTQELKRVREVQQAQEAKRNSQASGTYDTLEAFEAPGQGASGVVAVTGGGKADAGAASRGVRKPSVKGVRAEKNSVDTGSTRKLSTGELGASRLSVGKSGSQKPRASEPHVNKPSAENVGGRESTKRSVSAGKPRKSSSGQTVHRRKPTHRPGMSALVPDVEKAAPEEEFSTKATVSFFDGAEPESGRGTPSSPFQNTAEDADFDPYAAADAAFEAGYADDEPFETKKTVAFSDDGADGPSGTTGVGPQGNGAGSAAGVSSPTASPTGKTPPSKPAHPSLRYRIASVAMGLKAASNDPNEQGEAKPSGRSIVMPTGGKKEAVSDFVEAVSEKRPHLSRGRIITITVWVVIGLLVLLTLLFCWNRWWRYDDVLDVQGTWSANNSPTHIVLNGQYMQLTDDVLYSYEIDPFSKTIKYEFGTTKGQGRYRFSFNRDELVITDGDYSWFSTLQEDIPWTLETLWKNLIKEPLRSPLGDENVSVLKRVSRDANLSKTPKTDEEMAAWRQEAREAAAKAEEEALSGGGITVLNVTEGVPIEKPKENTEGGEGAGTDSGNGDGSGDGSTNAWQDPNVVGNDGTTWDDGSTWSDGSDQWNQGYDQGYDPGYDQSWDTGGYDQTYDQSYDQGYNTGYDPAYDQNYDANYDAGNDQGYDQNYDQSYDTTGETGASDGTQDVSTDAGAAGYDDGLGQMYTEGY